MTKSTTYSEKELLFRVVRGETAAFEELFTRYYGIVYSGALLYTKVHELAEDVTQQVFLKVWEKRASLGTIGMLDSYLFIMARNEMVDMLRRQSRQEKYIDHLKEIFEEEEGTPEDQLIHKQKRALLHQVVSSLPPQQQLVWRYSRDKGLRYDDIARKMGISHHTVKAHIRTAVKSVRAFLEAHKDEFLLLALAWLGGY